MDAPLIPFLEEVIEEPRNDKTLGCPRRETLSWNLELAARDSRRLLALHYHALVIASSAYKLKLVNFL